MTAPKDTPSPSRPRSVTLLAVGVLMLAGLHLARLIGVVRTWDFLAGLLPFSPLYLALTGLVWALLGFLLGWGLWRGLPWAPRLARWTSPAYLLYYWLDRLLLSNSSTRQLNWPFAAAASAALLVLVFWVLSRRKSKVFFKTFTGESYDHRS